MKTETVPTDRLAYPDDLDAWRAWQRSTHRLRGLRHGVSAAARRMVGAETAESMAPMHVVTRGPSPRVLFAVDATTPTQMASVLRPVSHLKDLDVAVVCVGEPDDALRRLGERPAQWKRHVVHDHDDAPRTLGSVCAVVGVGHYLAAGAIAHRWSDTLGATFVVVQHGLVTPFAPPLPAGAHLAAFSEQDAHYYLSGRTDLTYEVTGSQLLWSATREARAVDERVTQGPSPLPPPVFLGQLHGAELPRSDFAKAATSFCSTAGALYRPHPGETDKVSRIQHAMWQLSGIGMDPSGMPLHRLGAPVASVFSTGVLEAAARGLPARVTHPDPPAWLRAFWDRYGMVRWDGTAHGAVAAGHDVPATPAPHVPDIEPSRAVAAILRRLTGTGSGADPRGENE